MLVEVLEVIVENGPESVGAFRPSRSLDHRPFLLISRLAAMFLAFSLHTPICGFHTGGGIGTCNPFNKARQRSAFGAGRVTGAPARSVMYWRIR